MSKQLKFSLFLFLFLLLVVSTFHAQQWNVFNKAYRYNYKADNSPIVTNVLFADSVKQNGSDTIYYLNRIVTQCLSNCPYDTTGNSSHKYYYANMPQFLQRCVKKHAGGLVKLFDTTSMYIKPTCTLNETWIFDSIYSVQALCANISTQIVFGIQDSVKTILLNNNDTIKLSKSFGLIVFPEPYGKNKYYRVSGIEWKNSYDQTSLFGEKVPNAWDFYDFQVGDIMYKTESFSSAGNGNHTFYKIKLTSKSTIGNTYSYGCSQSYYNFSGPEMHSMICGDIPITSQIISGTTTLQFLNLNSPALKENLMYPGLLLSSNGNANIVRFGTDENGKLYKFHGKTCNNYTLTNVPNSSVVGIHSITPLYYKNFQGVNFAPYQYNVHYGQSFGKVSSLFEYWEGAGGENLTSFIRNGITYFGQPGILSINEFTESDNSFLFPNPANDFADISSNTEAQVKIYNIAGKELLTKSISNTERIDISELDQGLYFVELKSDNNSRVQKLIIKR